MEHNERKVYDFLHEMDITYEKYIHPPLFTIADIDGYEEKEKLFHCKNLFLRNSKGDIHYLLIIESYKNVNLRSVAKQISSTRLSFASAERLKYYLGLEPGAVSAFGLINDKERIVRVLIDKDLEKRKKITFHPNINTASITMNYGDFKRLMEKWGNPIQYIDIGEDIKR